MTRAARRPFAASSTRSLIPSCCLQAMCCRPFSRGRAGCPTPDAIDAPAARHALAGATVIASLASFPATVTSTIEATESVKYRSKHLKCGIILAAPGKGESTTDNVYSGLCMVAENGEVLASDECEDCFVVSEIDVEYLENLRRQERQIRQKPV